MYILNLRDHSFSTEFGVAIEDLAEVQSGSTYICVTYIPLYIFTM